MNSRRLFPGNWIGTVTKGRWPRRNLKISNLRELRGREKERQTEGVAYDFNYSWQHASLIASSQRCFHLSVITLSFDFFAIFSRLFLTTNYKWLPRCSCGDRTAFLFVSLVATFCEATVGQRRGEIVEGKEQKGIRFAHLPSSPAHAPIASLHSDNK